MLITYIYTTLNYLYAALDAGLTESGIYCIVNVALNLFHFIIYFAFVAYFY